jgi:hypothetical protein
MALNSYHWSAEGVRVKFSSGTRTVIGGPFGQAKEIVAGYWILQVKSMDEAADRHGVRRAQVRRQHRDASASSLPLVIP